MVRPRYITGSVAVLTCRLRAPTVPFFLDTGRTAAVRNAQIDWDSARALPEVADMGSAVSSEVHARQAPPGDDDHAGGMKEDVVALSRWPSCRRGEP